MATTVSMPQLGETVTEGTILRWAKQVGDSVVADETLVEISTDKVDTEVPSPASGVVVQILVGEGDTVSVGTAIAVIGEEGSVPTPEAAPQPVAAETPGAPPAAPPAAPPPSAPVPPAPATAPPGPAAAGTVTVSMPQLGETVTEGTILRWAKQVGDSVVADETLVEISTDKVDTEVPSPASGVVVQILVGEGDTVSVGTAIAVIGAEGAAPVSSPPPAAAPSLPETPLPPQEVPPLAETAIAPAPPGVPSPAETVTTPPPPAPAGVGENRLLSPVVRRLVREHDVDLGLVTGTGEGGRVTRRDVEAHIAARGVAPAAPAGVGVPPVITPAPAAAVAAPVAPTAAPPAAPAAGGDEEVPLDRLRVRIGENMIRAKQTAAHVWTSVEVDYERVERIRQRRKDAFKTAEGFSLTYLPFIARATVDALQEYPVVNSSFYLEEKKAVFHRAVNMGIAIDLEQRGLVVASIRNADGLRLVGIARQIRTLAEKARAGKLDPDDVMGATFTITNPGPFGSFMSAPIINVPNTGILSTDTVTKRPAVITGVDGEDVIAIRHIGYLGLTWDHRAFDGSTAVAFLQRIKQNLESWDWEQELG
jgi:2-oxoglutarate dehydrogenase E2 component (dihydrolipoamide succinyltransferase)